MRKAGYYLSDQYVPPMVAQWAVERGGKDYVCCYRGRRVGGTEEGDSTQEEEENSVHEKKEQEMLV